MKVILLGELRGKGGEGDIVEVAQGYAENFLFPQKIAQPATPGNIKQLEERRHNIAKREAELKSSLALKLTASVLSAALPLRPRVVTMLLLICIVRLRQW